MKTLLLRAVVIVAAVTAWESLAVGEITYTPADVDNLIAVPAVRGAVPTLRIDVPPGTTVVARMTGSDGQYIRNPDGTLPNWHARVRPGDLGVELPVYPTLNGRVVTDQEITINDVTIVAPVTTRLGAMQGAAPHDLLPLTDWLADNSYFNPHRLSIGNFTADATAVYAAVDVGVWSRAGYPDASLPIGSTFDVVDGLANGLPGYLFSATEATHGNDGWESDSLFTGTVTLHSYDSLAVPEPFALELAILGIVCLLLGRMIPPLLFRWPGGSG